MERAANTTKRNSRKTKPGMEDPHPEDPFYKNSPYPPRTPGVRPFAESPYPPRMKNAPIVNRAYTQDEYPTQGHRLEKLIGRSSD